jgi:hypothetical protein
MLPVHLWRFTFLTSDDARQALDRVAASETFRDAENLRRLVLYLGEASLSGRADRLKEYTVGVEVLGRPSHYEPRVDSSARMLAARLRRKLEDYYRGEGAAEVVRIDFPKGGFKLTFETAKTVPDGVQAGVAAGETAKWRLVAGICAAAFLAIAVYAAVLKIRTRVPVSAVELTPEVEALWQPFLDGRIPITVSFGSPLFVALDRWMVRTPGLNDWSQTASYPGLKQLQSAVGAAQISATYDYAGIGDVNGAFLVGKLLGARTSQLTLKRGAVLSWEDIQNNHLVFIGNGKNQEKLRYLMEHLEFTLNSTGVHCHNPRPGEPADYLNIKGQSASNSEYGLISYLPGSRKGRQMIILSAEGTSAIWGVTEAVTNPRFAEPLVRRLRHGGPMPKAFQAVIRISVNAGVPVTLDYVVHHEVPADQAPLK